MRENRKKNIKLAVLVLILLLGIGFAALTATLKIDGTVNVAKTTWDVHFENVSITEGSVTANPAPTSNNTTTTEMTYTINFTKPGDFYEFTVDIVNDGTIDAMVDVIANKTYASNGTTEIALPTYLTSTVTYSDGIAIQPNQELLHGESETIKVRVEFKKDISVSDLPSSGDTTIVFKLNEEYKQKDENSKPVRKEADFEEDTWEDMIIAYDSGLTDKLEQAMSDGTTREVQLDLDNDGTPETTAHLRIANMSAPAECATEGFSRSACGFVLEFADIITTHRMNPYDSGTIDGDGNYGGWEHSEMRNYLNSTIYNALPSELKSRIIETPVVSGHGSRQSDNFYTIDKLYLLGAMEVWGENPGYDSAASLTRQLDYYHDKGVTTSNYSGAIKMNLSGVNAFWWLRSATSDDNGSFYDVNYYGRWNASISVNADGVSPAFRIR